jgi:hypothetical protein
VVDKPILLDEHRPRVARRAVETRRRRSEADANLRALQVRASEIERDFVASPSRNWSEVIEKARHLLALFAATPMAQDPLRQKLIASVLDDFRSLPRGAEPPRDS